MKRVEIINGFTITVKEEKYLANTHMHTYRTCPELKENTSW